VFELPCNLAQFFASIYQEIRRKLRQTWPRLDIAARQYIKALPHLSQRNP